MSISDYKNDTERLVFEENMRVHRFESRYYDKIHQEIFNVVERKRLRSLIRRHIPKNLDGYVMDFGCGTGNMTSMLLEQLPIEVVAADSSPEMISILRRKFGQHIAQGRLHTLLLEKPRETVWPGQFSAILMYSVLHHIYDVKGLLDDLCMHLKDGGLLIIEHEASDTYWNLRKSRMYSLYLMSCAVLNNLYNAIHKRPMERIDYAISDYWARPETHLAIGDVVKLLESKGLHAKVEGYLLFRTRLPNPLYFLFSPFLSDSVRIIARKKYTSH